MPRPVEVVHVVHHLDPEQFVAILARVGTGTDSSALAGIRRELEQLRLAVTAQGELMAGELEALTSEVTRNTEVDQSAITLLNGLAAKIESLKTDPAALQALADSMRNSSDALAAAVVANTPAAA